mgnify:CR=1 FL=1
MQKVLEMIIATLRTKLDEAKSSLGWTSSTTDNAQKLARQIEIKEIENTLKDMIVLMKKKTEAVDIQTGELKKAFSHLERISLRDDIAKLNDELFEGFDLYPKNNDDLKQVIVDLYNSGYAANDPKRLTIYDDSRIAAHLSNQKVSAAEYNQFKEAVAKKFVEDDYAQSGVTKSYEDIDNTVLDLDGYPVAPSDLKSNIVDIKTGEKIVADPKKSTLMEFFDEVSEPRKTTTDPIKQPADPLRAEYIDSGAADTMSFEEFVIKKNKGDPEDSFATGGRVGFALGGYDGGGYYGGGYDEGLHPLIEDDLIKEFQYEKLGIMDGMEKDGMYEDYGDASKMQREELIEWKRKIMEGREGLEPLPGQEEKRRIMEGIEGLEPLPGQEEKRRIMEEEEIGTWEEYQQWRWKNSIRGKGMSVEDSWEKYQEWRWRNKAEPKIMPTRPPAHYK